MSVVARTDWPVAGWRAWYADGSTYRSNRHAWVDLPADGVVAVKLFYDRFTRGGVRYTHALDGGDWYWRWGRTGAHPEDGRWLEPPADVPTEELKRGVWVSDLDFDLITQKVRASEWP